MEDDYEINMEELESKIFDIVLDVMKEYPDKEENSSYIFSLVNDAVDNVADKTYLPTKPSVQDWLDNNLGE